MLEERAAAAAQPPQAAPPPSPQPGQYQQPPAQPRGRAPREEPGMFEKVLKSPVARSVATQITRTVLGAMLGTPSRRRRRGSLW